MTTYRAADLYTHLDRNHRPDLSVWLGYLSTFSPGRVEGKGMATTIDRVGADYEVSVYCLTLESKEAAQAWLDGCEVVSEADLAYIEETAANIDRALAADVALWEAEDEVGHMTAEGVAATEVSPFMEGVVDLDVEYDVLRMGAEAVEPLLQRLQDLGDSVISVKVLRHVGCSVPVYVGSVPPGAGRRFVASQLAEDVGAEWARIARFDEAVEALQRG